MCNIEFVIPYVMLLEWKLCVYWNDGDGIFYDGVFP